MKPTKEQIANVRLLLDKWSSVPEAQVYFDFWYWNQYDGRDETPKPGCRTVACLAGWANMLDPWKGRLAHDDDPWNISWSRLRATFGTESIFQPRDEPEANDTVSDHALAEARMRAWLAEHDTPEAQ
jgi:hypothetical protein